MTCIAKTDINANEIISNMTVRVKVTGRRLCMLRLKIACLVLRVLRLKAVIEP